MSKLTKLAPRVTAALAPLALVVTLVLSMGGRWTTRSAMAAPAAQLGPRAASPSTATSSSGVGEDDRARPRAVKKAPVGKLNLNTATEEQLLMLPTVGPAKAERIVTWRKKNGGFKRVADLRRVKGFGYRTFKRLEPLLEIKGDTTLALK